MRLDHIAYRVPDRDKTVHFLESLTGYSVGTEFQINFDDGSSADLHAPNARPSSSLGCP